MRTSTTRSAKRSFAAVLAAALVASLLALVSTPVSAAATVTATKRFTGADRYATANAVANYGTVTNQGKFVLVNGNSFADGLAASALAGAVNGALLLTEKDATPNSVLTTMNSMSSAVAGANKYVFLVGGTSMISAAQAATLTASGWTVTRVSGANRYATADAVAAMVKTQNGGSSGSLGGYKTAFLANGNSFADALSVSSMAYDNKLPIFLTDGTTLSTGTAAQMKASGIQKVMVLGGTAAVSAAVATAADAVSTVAVVQRLSGSDRYATSKAVADALGLLDATRKIKAVLVDGNNFPDGLAASQYAASIDASILLVNGSTLPTDISSWLTSRQSTLTDIATVGGTTAVPAAAVTAAKAAATTAAITATFSKAVDGGTTYTVTFSGRVTSASAQTVGNYIHTFATGGTQVANGAVYSYSTTTGVSKAVVTTQTAMKPGDGLTVVGGAIADYTTTTGVTVAKASTTVTALSGAPSATISAEAGVDNADKAVYITFNMAIKDATFAAAGDVTVTDAVVGGTAALLDNCGKIVGFTWSCDDTTGGEALSTGDTVTLGAGKVTSNATVPVNNIAASTVTTNDITAPVLNSATYTALAASTVQANQAFMHVIGLAADATGASGDFNVDATKGDVKVSVKAGSALAGRAGNAVKMVVDVNGTAHGCAYAAATKILTISVKAVTDHAPEVTDAINASASCKDLFVATSVMVAGQASFLMTGAADTTTGNIALGGGLDQFDVTLTFSEPMAATTAKTLFTFTVNNGTTVNDASVTGKTTVIAELQQELNGVMIYTITTAHPVSTGLDKVTAETGLTDLAGNALVHTATSAVVPMYVQ